MISMTVARNESYYFALQNEHALEYYKTESEGYFLSTPEGFSHEGKVTAETLRDFAGVKRYAVDITVSAPKSISVAWALGDEKVRQDMLEAHKYAVEQVAKEIQNYIYTRDRSKAALESGQIYQKAEGVIIGFDHYVSRAQDPQLHTHILVMNKVQNEKGEWKSIESKFLFEQQRYFDAVYKLALAEKLSELGYRLRGTADGFEIASIKESLIAEFSQRSQQIEAALAQKGLTRETASAKEREIATLDTRQKKEHKDINTLRQEWQARAGEELKIEKFEKTLSYEDRARELIAKTIDALSYNHSVISKERLIVELQSTLHLNNVFVSRKFIEEEVTKYIEKGVIFDKGVERQYAAIKSVKELEEKIVNEIESMRNTKQAFMNEQEAKEFLEKREQELGISFTEDQKRVIQATLTSTDAVQVWQGVAGAGKTFTLSQLAGTFRENGFKIIAVAPTGKAVDTMVNELRAAGLDVDGKTLDRFRIDVEEFKRWENLLDAMQNVNKALNSQDIVFEIAKSELFGTQYYGQGKVYVSTKTRGVLTGEFRDKLSIEYEKLARGKNEIEREILNTHKEIKSLVIERRGDEVRYIVTDKETQKRHMAIEAKFSRVLSWSAPPNPAREKHGGSIKSILRRLGIEVNRTETWASQIATTLGPSMAKEFRTYELKNGAKMIVEKRGEGWDIHIKTRDGEITTMRYENGKKVYQETFITQKAIKEKIKEFSKEYAKSIFIVDETSMSSVRNMDTLVSVMKNLEGTQSRALLIGDIHQLKAVSEGDIFRNIQQETKTEKTELTTIFRQKDPVYKQITTAISQKDFDTAIRLMESSGKVKVLNFNKAVERVQTKFRYKDTLVVTSRNKGAELLNQIIRDKLIAEGHIDSKVELGATVRTPKPIETVKLIQAKNYELNDVLLFQKDALKSLGIKGYGNEFKVVGVNADKNTITIEAIQSKSKQRFEINAMNIKYNSVSVFQEKGLNFAKGDLVMTLKNDRKLGVKNGEMWEVVNVDIQKNLLHLKNEAKEVVIDLKQYNYINYAYAITTHKSQGMTTKEVIYVSDDKS
ncbi:MAG: MobF family relaxase, partial [Archaeoglobaceae archaeon]